MRDDDNGDGVDGDDDDVNVNVNVVDDEEEDEYAARSRDVHVSRGESPPSSRARLKRPSFEQRSAVSGGKCLASRS